MKRAVITAALLLGACQDRQQFEPGKWAITVTMSAGQTELWSSTVERCITGPETEDLGLSILNGTPLGQCDTGRSSHTGGTLSAVGMCLGRLHPMATSATSTNITLNGRYAARSIDGDISARVAGEPDQSGTVTARRLGDC